MPKGVFVRKPRRTVLVIGDKTLRDETPLAVPVIDVPVVGRSLPTRTAFEIVYDGEGLWHVDKLTHNGETILSCKQVTDGDSKASALQNMKVMAYKHYYLEMNIQGIEERRADV